MVPVLIEYSLAVVFVLVILFSAWQLICVFILKIANPVLTGLGNDPLALNSCRNTTGFLKDVGNWIKNIDIHLRPLPSLDFNFSLNMGLILTVIVLAVALVAAVRSLIRLARRMDFDFSELMDTLTKGLAGIGLDRILRRIFGGGKRPKPSVKPPVKRPAIQELKPDSIFISYRRKDSADIAGRIYDGLALRFGSEAVFKDIDSIHPGTDFVERLTKALDSCGVLLAVIGDQWLERDPITGKCRLENTGDYVRFEIEAAIRKNIPIIPLAVRGAVFPSRGHLPASMEKLSTQNGIQIRADPDFRHDMDRLVKALTAILSKQN